MIILAEKFVCGYMLVCVLVHVYVHVTIHMYADVCEHMCGGQRSTSSAISQETFTLFVETGSMNGLEFTM